MEDCRVPKGRLTWPHSAVPSELTAPKSQTPALKRRAIVVCPFGTERAICLRWHWRLTQKRSDERTPNSPPTLAAARLGPDADLCRCAGGLLAGPSGTVCLG